MDVNYTELVRKMSDVKGELAAGRTVCVYAHNALVCTMVPPSGTADAALREEANARVPVRTDEIEVPMTDEKVRIIVRQELALHSSIPPKSLPQWNTAYRDKRTAEPAPKTEHVEPVRVQTAEPPAPPPFQPDDDQAAIDLLFGT